MKLFIFLSVFFLGCKSTEIRKSCKRNLELELSKNWRYDAVKKGYISNSKFLTELDSLYKDCLHGMDTTKIAKLFGNNYVISQRGIENDFLMNYPIINSVGDWGGVFYFVLDEKYKVKMDYFLGLGGGTIHY